MNRHLALPLAAIAVLLAAAVWLQVARERAYRWQETEPSLSLTAGVVNRLAFAHRPLLADLHWIRTIQYFGGQRRRIEAEVRSGAASLAELQSQIRYDLLYPLLDVTTTLDPLLNIAYRFGAIFLSAPYPNGAGQPERAIELLQKGLRTLPDKWQYLHDIGFVYYWDLHDYPQAAAYFNRAADIPGAPWWMRSVAATTLARGGNRAASRLLWRQQYDDAQDERARQAALLKLQQLDALEQIEQLQELIDAFIERTGARSTSWQALVAAGAIGSRPLDPSGTPYELDGSARVTLSMRSLLFPLPIEPAPRRDIP